MPPYRGGRDWALGYFTSPYFKKNGPKFILSPLSCPYFWRAQVLVCFPWWSPDAFPIPASHQLPVAAALGCNCGQCESWGERKALSWQRARQQPSCKTPQFLPLIKDVAIFYLRNPLLALKVALQLTKNKARSTTPVCIPRSRA